MSPIALLLLLAPAPAPPDDLEASVARMSKIGYCNSPTLSPDGTRLAFVSNLTGVPQVWMIPAEGGWPTLLTALDDPVSYVTWSPSGEWLAFTSAPGGGMNQQVYLIRPDGAGLHRITDGGKETNWLGGWTHDGRLLTLASNRRSAASMDAYTYAIENRRLRLVAQNPGTGGITEISRDHRRAVLYRVESRSDSNLFLLDLATGQERLLTPHTGPGNFSGGDFSPDAAIIYLASDKDRDLAAFARIRIGGDGQPGPIEVIAARDDAELQGYKLTEDGASAALLWNHAGLTELSFLDLATLKATPGPKLPHEMTGGLVFSKDGRRLVMAMAGAAAPADLWVLERPSGRLTQLTRSPHAGVDLARLVRPQLVRFRAHDDLALSGWLYLPAGFTAPGPMVLSFHGGPEGQERPTFHADYQALLARGIAVFAPNVRGSAGFGKKFVNLDNGPLRVNGVRDIKACVDYVVKAGTADPKRLGIMGGSYGGYMVMAGLTEFSELFAAGANLYGVVNFATFFAHTEPWMAAVSTIEYGDPKTQADLLRSLSPIHKVDKVLAPTIVLHGVNDTNVPVVEAEQVVSSLKKRGVPVEYILFPDEGHGFRKTVNRIRANVAVTRWFERYLKPAPSAAPRLEDFARALGPFKLRGQSFTVTLEMKRLAGAARPDPDFQETVARLLIRDQAGQVHYQRAFPYKPDGDRFEDTTSVDARVLEGGKGAGLLLTYGILPSTPLGGQSWQLFGLKAGKLVPFSPPLATEGSLEKTSPHPSLQADLLEFRVWTGNFFVFLPLRADWIMTKVMPAWRCVKMTAQGPKPRCQFQVQAERRPADEMTFVRLFPDTTEQEGIAEHAVVKKDSKVEFLAAEAELAWDEQADGIGFGVSGEVWLKVRVDGKEGWIHKEEDFRAIGLPAAG